LNGSRPEEQQPAEGVTMFTTFRNTALAAVAIGLALTSSAHADLLLFQWVNGSNTASWEQQSNPMPTSSDSVSTAIGVLNGTETTGAGTDSFTTVVFFTLADFGGFDTDTGNIVAEGPQLFTGPTSSPMFSAQTVNLRVPAGGTGILTVTAVPEPGSLPLLVMGLAGLGMVCLRTRRA
jgi:hypothetical protein